MTALAVAINLEANQAAVDPEGLIGDHLWQKSRFSFKLATTPAEGVARGLAAVCGGRVTRAWTPWWECSGRLLASSCDRLRWHRKLARGQDGPQKKKKRRITLLIRSGYWTGCQLALSHGSAGTVRETGGGGRREGWTHRDRRRRSFHQTDRRSDLDSPKTSSSSLLTKRLLAGFSLVHVPFDCRSERWISCNRSNNRTLCNEVEVLHGCPRVMKREKIVPLHVLKGELLHVEVCLLFMKKTVSKKTCFFKLVGRVNCVILYQYESEQKAGVTLSPVGFRKCSCHVHKEKRLIYQCMWCICNRLKGQSSPIAQLCCVAFLIVENELPDEKQIALVFPPCHKDLTHRRQTPVQAADLFCINSPVQT